MGQKSTESEERIESTRLDIDRDLGVRSKRQREGTDATSVFGKRTMGSDLLFFEGILPEKDGELLSTHSMEEQTKACLDTLESMLEERDVTLADVMKVEIHLTDTDGAPAVDRVYDRRFPAGERPPRTVVGVCSLPGGADVQFDIVAAEE